MLNPTDNLRTQVKFDIKFIHPYRGLILFTLLPLGLFLTSLEINRQVTNTVLSISLILTLLAVAIGLVYYFMFGRLTISVENEALNIQWTKRLLFDFNKTTKIPFKDITKLRIDRQLNSNQRALKIYFNTETNYIQSNTFYINSYDNNIFRGDLIKLMDYLTDLSNEKSIRITNHWEEWNEKGYTKLVSRLMIASLLIMAVYFILKTTDII